MSTTLPWVIDKGNELESSHSYSFCSRTLGFMDFRKENMTYTPQKTLLKSLNLFESSPKAFEMPLLFYSYLKAYVELRVGIKAGMFKFECIVKLKVWTKGEIQSYSLIKTLLVDGNDGKKKKI